MTKPTTTTFGSFLIKLGNGADPEVFASPCGLTGKGFNQTATAQETTVPDCDNPDAPAYTERAVDTNSAEISGSGIMAQEAFDTWNDWFQSGASKNVQIYPMGASGGYYQGAFILTALNQQAERGKKVTVDVTIQSDGQWTWTP